MKKLLFTIGISLAILPAESQSYFKLEFEPESSVNACDAKIKIVPINLTPPYLTSFAHGNRLLGQGLNCENICSGEIMYISCLDSACRNMYSYWYITPDPDDMVLLDTVTGSVPTPGYSNGSLNFYFDQLPSGFTKAFGLAGNTSATTSTSFTGLSEGLYTFLVYNPSSPYIAFGVDVYLGTAPTPCDYTPYEIQQVPASAPDGETTFCDAEVLMLVDGEIADGYGTMFNYLSYDGGAQTMSNDSSAHPQDVCRGMYQVGVWPYNNAYFFPLSYLFVEDSSDIHTVWGEPGIVPAQTDTLWLSATDNCFLDYTSALDTAYISNWQPLGAQQFELTVTLVQDTDTFNFYCFATLDSATNYFFDLTTYCRSLLNFSHQDHFRNIIYFAALDTRSLFFSGVTDMGAYKIAVYPNPFDHMVQIRSEREINMVELYDINGKRLQSYGVNGNTFDLSTDVLTPGVYLLKVYDQSGGVNVSRIAKISK